MVCLSSPGPPPGKPVRSPCPSARLMRVQVQLGTYTHRSRGMDSIVSDGVSGSTLTSIIVSVRHPPSLGRRSLPIKMMLSVFGLNSRSGAGEGAVPRAPVITSPAGSGVTVSARLTSGGGGEVGVDVQVGVGVGVRVRVGVGVLVQVGLGVGGVVGAGVRVIVGVATIKITGFT